MCVSENMLVGKKNAIRTWIDRRGFDVLFTARSYASAVCRRRLVCVCVCGCV